MSTRTIIEVNHDYIEDMKDKGHLSYDLYYQICASYTGSPIDRPVDGVRILGSRHHSETLELKVE